LANIGTPGTVGFVGEFIAYLGISQVSFYSALAMLTSVLLSAVFTMRLYNRLFFGRVNKHLFGYYRHGVFFYLKSRQLHIIEDLILFISCLMIVGLGFYPDLLNLIFFMRSLAGYGL